MLGKFVGEVEEYMSLEEYIGWYHYFQLEIEEEKEARKKASKKQPRR